MSMLENSDHGLMPVIYIPHGGGPLPLLGEENHKEIIHFLKTLPEALPRPKAIVMVSAHWEGSHVLISAASHPPMIYDYGGFPAETYEYQYPAPGEPELANHIHELLSNEGIANSLDPVRGFDHGTFVPLMLMYPEADIPVVQVSLLQSFDPEQHINLGKALASLRKQGVLIIGSGMSFHHSKASPQDNDNFENWLSETLLKKSPSEVSESLKAWAVAPGGRASHAREEHLLPLHVCWGAASEEHQKVEKIFDGGFFTRRISGYLWQ